MKRLVGIAAVWLGCSLAWVILGSTLLVRSDDSSLTGSSDVHQLWGPPTEQRQPTASYMATRMVESSRTMTDANGVMREVATQRPESYAVPIPLIRSEVEAEIALEQRRRGLSWYPTYTVELAGRYTFKNDSGEAQDVAVAFPLSAAITETGPWYEGQGSTSAIFDGFIVRDEQARSVPFEIEAEQATWSARLNPGEERTFDVGYVSRGTERWQYRMAAGTTRVTNFSLDVTTDFADVDFPQGTMSPTEHSTRGATWHGNWSFESSIANRPIGVEMPTRINPGPLAARITFFAPVGLLFFFFVVGILAMARKQDLHPMHYFFLGCSFFAFHLLFAYLVDHFSIPASFGVASAVSSVLVCSYARLFTGWRFALQHIGISQFLYLILFSFTFLWEGFTGLSITVGAILTLFVMMQITGRMKWGAKAISDVETGEPRLPTPEEAILDARPKAF